MNDRAAFERWRLNLCRWVESLGVNPADVPMPPQIDIDQRLNTVTIEVVARRPDGSSYIDPTNPDRIARERRVIKLDGPIPPWPPQQP